MLRRGEKPPVSENGQRTLTFLPWFDGPISTLFLFAVLHFSMAHKTLSGQGVAQKEGIPLC